MKSADLLKLRVFVIMVLGVLGGGPAARSDSLTDPVRIATSTAFNGPTLGIPRWKGYMSESDPNQFWATYSNGSRALSNVSFTTDGGTTWSTNAIQIDPTGYLDMHCSVFGRNGNLYATWPGRNGVMFRKFNAPIQSNADADPAVTIAGTSYSHRSNLMVQNTGRIWLFTRRSNSSTSENVLYNYSDNDGASWSHGTAFATNSMGVRIGSMPYVGGNPALVVLYLNSPRGFEYYLWNGTSFEAQPDHSIYGVNTGYNRAFSHNVVSDTTFHLFFGEGNSLLHVWKNFNNGSGEWNREIVDNSATTINNDWHPTSTVRGDDLYVFYCKKSTASSSSSDIYYKKWSQQAQSWTAPLLVSTGASVSNTEPNTCFQVPASSPYVPVFWRSGSSPFEINFAKVVVETVDSPPSIDCPSEVLTATSCGTNIGCVPLAIQNYASVVVDPPTATWSNGQLTFPATSPGTRDVRVTAYPSDPAFDPVVCDLTVNVHIDPVAEITCPTDTIDVSTCYPMTFSVSLPIVNQTQVDVTGATWSANQLSFDADTSGIYSFLVTASNPYNSTACNVVVRAEVWPALDLYIAEEDLTTSAPDAFVGETVTLSADIHSDARSRTASNITVQFFDGDPASGGTLIGVDQSIAVLSGGSSATTQVPYMMVDDQPHDIYVLVDPDGVIPECAEDNNIGVLTVEGVRVDGMAYGDVTFATAPMYGVHINLLDDSGDEYSSTVTDISGYYEFDSIPAGTYLVDLELPLGFAPTTFSTVEITVAGGEVPVDFVLRDIATHSITDFWWWKSQLTTIRTGAVPSSGMTRTDIDEYLGSIFDHFCERDDGFAIPMEGVTCTGSPIRALTFDDVTALWFDNLDNSSASRTRKYFLACLFNLASARLNQNDVVSLDGATASQAITYLGRRYLAGDSGATVVWYNLARIHTGTMIAAGVIPLSTPIVAYRSAVDDVAGSLPSIVTLSPNYPNPFNPTTTIAYSVPERSRVLLQVFNVLGQAVRTLVDEEKSPGTYAVVWDGTDFGGNSLGSGVYLYRITANSYTQGRKMLLLK